MKTSRWLPALLALLCAAAAAQTAVEEVRKKWPDFRYLDPGPVSYTHLTLPTKRIV